VSSASAENRLCFPEIEDFFFFFAGEAFALMLGFVAFDMVAASPLAEELDRLSRIVHRDADHDRGPMSDRTAVKPG
jgi:hypothetical protein